MLLHVALMGGVVAARQDAAMNLRMEGLDPSPEHLGRAGELLDRFDAPPGLLQSRLGAAG